MNNYLAIWFRMLLAFILVVPALLAFLVVRLVASDDAPRFLRWLLERAGGGYVKLGQLLALRVDLLPLRYCQELSILLDQVKPTPLAKIKAAIEADLGIAVDQCFSDFSAEPIGSASLAQVHTARLKSGESVAVKVLRPGIENMVRADLNLIRLAAAWYDASPIGGQTRFSGIADELWRLTNEELDLRREARAAHKLHLLFAADSLAHRGPKVYFKFVGRRVLTMEFFAGVAVTKLVDAVQRRDRKKLREYAAKGLTPRRTARLLFRSIMCQAYQFKMFHADPHPSNLILFDTGELGFVDFGMVGFLDESVWSQQYQLFKEISRGHIHRAYVLMTESLQPLNPRDLATFESEFKGLLQDWMITTGTPATIAEKSTGRFLLQTTMAIRRAGLSLPTDLLRLHRTTLVSDMVELQLYPELDLVQEMREFFREDAQRRLCETFDKEQVVEWAEDSAYVARNWVHTSRAVLEWIDTRLPQISRSFEYEITRFDEVLAITTRALRSVAWLSGPIVIAIWLFGTLIPTDAPPPFSWLYSLSQSLNGYLVALWFVGSLLVIRVLSQIERPLRS